MQSKLAALLRPLPWLLLIFVLFRTAWVCDDAYITFRTVDNLVHGHGAVFNVGERVQAYTHPLWMLLHVPFHVIFKDIYWVTLSISMLCSLAAFLLLGRASRGAWIALPFMVVASKCLVEYSSSGLENPLSFLLLALFMGLWMKSELEPPRLLHLSLVAGLIYLNRMDAILLVGPALAWAFWQQRSWHALGQIALGMLPVLAWEVFSLTYYGFLFPNTAYAKLGTGIESGILMKMGMAYLKDSLQRDPVTLPLIVLGILSGLRKQRYWPFALGIALYLFYILRIGGDFMSGRFLAVPLLLALFLLSKAMTDRQLWLNGLALAAFGCSFIGPTPMLLSDVTYTLPREAVINSDGVADERAFFYPGTGLLHAFAGRDMPDFRWVKDGKAARSSEGKVIAQDAIGFFSYYAGPEKYILDRLALSDPLLARIPTRYQGKHRAGHYDHLVPDGYAKQLADSTVQIVDPAAAKVAKDLAVITRGPIFDAARFGLIWQYNVVEPAPKSLAHFRVPVHDTIALQAGDTSTYQSRNGFGLLFTWTGDPDSLRFDALTLDRHTVAWMRDGKPVSGADLKGKERLSVAVPEGIHEAAIYPWQNWPVDKLRSVEVR